MWVSCVFPRTWSLVPKRGEETELSPVFELLDFKVGFEECCLKLISWLLGKSRKGSERMNETSQEQRKEKNPRAWRSSSYVSPGTRGKHLAILFKCIWVGFRTLLNDCKYCVREFLKGEISSTQKLSKKKWEIWWLRWTLIKGEGYKLEVCWEALKHQLESFLKLCDPQEAERLGCRSDMIGLGFWKV